MSNREFDPTPTGLAWAGYPVSGILHLLIALAMWRFAEALLGLRPAESTQAHRRDSPISDRLKVFGLGLI